MKQKAFKAGEIVRVTNSVEALEKTQDAPRSFAEAVAGKECKVIAAYKDGSYDLEGTPLMLDATVLTFVRKSERVRKHAHVWDEQEGNRVCVTCGKSRKLPNPQ